MIALHDGVRVDGFQLVHFCTYRLSTELLPTVTRLEPVVYIAPVVSMAIVLVLVVLVIIIIIIIVVKIVVIIIK